MLDRKQCLNTISQLKRGQLATSSMARIRFIQHMLMFITKVACMEHIVRKSDPLRMMSSLLVASYSLALLDRN